MILNTRRLGLLVAGALLWSLQQAVAIHPHPLSYFNVAAGGAANAPYLMDDSNVDWGQDLPALEAWQRRHGGVPLRLSYFGTVRPQWYGVRFRPMEAEEIVAPMAGYYAVSVHHLVWFRKLARERGAAYDWLSRFRPVDRAGYSILIYRFGR